MSVLHQGDMGLLFYCQWLLSSMAIQKRHWFAWTHTEAVEVRRDADGHNVTISLSQPTMKM